MKAIKKGTQVFIWDNEFLKDNIVRKYTKPTKRNYIAIPVDEFACPKCGAEYTDNKSNLVLGREALDDNGNALISNDYSGACLNCDEDFFLFEMVNNLDDYIEPTQGTNDDIAN